LKSLPHRRIMGLPGVDAQERQGSRERVASVRTSR
jgi:hypothetical protein